MGYKSFGFGAVTKREGSKLLKLLPSICMKAIMLSALHCYLISPCNECVCFS